MHSSPPQFEGRRSWLPLERQAALQVQVLHILASLRGSDFVVDQASRMSDAFGVSLRGWYQYLQSNLTPSTTSNISGRNAGAAHGCQGSFVMRASSIRQVNVGPNLMRDPLVDIMVWIHVRHPLLRWFPIKIHGRVAKLLSLPATFCIRIRTQKQHQQNVTWSNRNPCRFASAHVIFLRCPVCNGQAAGQDGLALQPLAHSNKRIKSIGPPVERFE